MNLESMTTFTNTFPVGMFAADALQMSDEAEGSVEETEEVAAGEVVEDDDDESDDEEEEEAA